MGSRTRATDLLLAAVAVGLTITSAGCAQGDQPTSVSAPSSTISVEQQQADLAASMGIQDPPVVRVIRSVLPEERDALVATCLATKGYSIDSYGGYTFPTEQQSVFDLANFECLAAYPINEQYTQPWTEVQTEVQYQYTVNTLIPCLENRGYSVSEPPSQEVFVSNWFTTPYYPFAQLAEAGLSTAEFTELESACPQTAPTTELWG